MVDWLRRLWGDEGATVGVEYALLLAVFGIGVVAAVVGALERVGQGATDFGQGVTGPSETCAVVGVVGK